MVFNSSENNNTLNFTQLINPRSQPPSNSTILIFNSTDSSDYKSSYTIKVQVTFANIMVDE